MSIHELYMQRCIELARLGIGSVSPNPMVGAVIVCDDQIIGEGYHQFYGQAHAEVNAINDVLKNQADAASLLKRSILYVNLEPCAHFGKTPPCADLIIRHQIPHIVIGCRDSFDQVNGKGTEKLRDAGILVTEGVLEKECLTLNKRFFTRVSKQRPYIILKWAKTADNYFAKSDKTPQWITSYASKQLVHRWRSEEDAVLIGKNTALYDNPQLNVREWAGKNPIRIVIDRNLELPPHLHLFDQSQKTIVFNSKKTEVNGNIQYLQLEDFDLLLTQLIAFQLYLMDQQSVIIEGGAQILNFFIKAGLWDEARIFTAPVIWKKGLKAPQLNASQKETTVIDTDTLEVWYNE
ncbi:MAG: bifunctional diaminohydroxyphosphoribosylaminopyrimidine deaminase/5-amino-6-(5-phosphoribosylamino)uracil reductase RibD [Daejeonella sp.]